MANERSETYSSNRKRENGFEDIDKLTNAEGMVAFISRRKSSGKITFAIMREFERDGNIEYTQFIPEHLIEPYLDLVKRVVARVREVSEAPRAVQGR